MTENTHKIYIVRFARGYIYFIQVCNTRFNENSYLTTRTHDLCCEIDFSSLNTTFEFKIKKLINKLFSCKSKVFSKE